MSISLIKLRLLTRQPFKISHFSNIQSRLCSFKADPFEYNTSMKFEATQDPDEWKYVERILPPKTVPEPKPLSEYPSGWKPQTDNVDNLPYFVSRTKNHMIPVYLKTDQRGMKRLTYLKNIQGDIWLLEKELVEFLQKDYTRPIRSQVHEVARYICINGDHVNAIKYYLMKKNL